MAKASKESMRARETVIRYVIAAELACELKCLDPEGNFSPHTVNAYARMLGRIVSMIMERFSIEQYKARKIAQRVMLVYLKHHIPYPTENEEAWINSEYIVKAELAPVTFDKTVEGVKPLVYDRIRARWKDCKDADLDRAWQNIKDEVDKAVSTWLMNGDPHGISAEGLRAHLCLLVSKFYGLIVGKPYEQKESVGYFLEREVLDYMTEEYLEINYVIQQRTLKAQNETKK